MLLPFAVGFALGLTVWWFSRVRARRADGDEMVVVDGRDTIDRKFVDGLVANSEAQLRSLATAIGRDLANSSMAVQTHAQLLCEAVDEPGEFVPRCEALWTGVDRLRLLSDKILTFATERDLAISELEVRAVLDEVSEEIESRHGNGLEVQHSTAAFLPPVRGHRRSLGNALHFLVETLLELEPDSRVLSIAAYAQNTGPAEAPRVAIELNVETHAGIARPVRGRQRPDGAPGERTPATVGETPLPLGYLAACNALDAQDASLSIRQTQGISATALVGLAAAHGPLGIETDAAANATNGRSDHDYRGVLILERDESIRSLLMDEIERHGRVALNSTDATMACALIEATPERFELLVLEVQAPRGGALAVLDLASERIPDCPVLLLTTATQELVADAEDRALLESHPVRLSKPFDLLELRKTLEALLPQPQGENAR